MDAKKLVELLGIPSGSISLTEAATICEKAMEGVNLPAELVGEANLPEQSAEEDTTTLADMTSGDAEDGGVSISEEGVPEQKLVIVRDTALDLDMWDLERGKTCLAQSEELRKAFPVYGKDEKWKKRVEEAVADLHGVAYLMDPKLVDQCTDPRRLEYVQTLLNSAECKALRSSTVMNDLASEMAATSFGQQYAVLLQEDEKREKANADKKRKGKGPSPEKEAMQNDMAVRRACSKALDKAKSDVEDFDSVCRSLGGDGSDGNNPQDKKKIAEAYRKIKNNEMLKRVFDRAGRFRLFMQSQQRKKITHGQDDMVGIEMAGDVHRLLPVELSMIADEDLEMDALRRLVEKQSMCREFRTIEKEARGPVVVCVDESGSMQGDPIWNAKAFALAMAQMAKAQGRWCALIGYSGATEGTKLVLPPGKWDEVQVIEWVTHFFSGGTDMDVPLEKLPGWWNTKEMAGLPQGKTDLILITDALCEVPPQMEANFNAWKAKNKVKVLSMIINSEPGDLARVSDEVFKVRGIDTNEEAVAKAMSI